MKALELSAAFALGVFFGMLACSEARADQGLEPKFREVFCEPLPPLVDWRQPATSYLYSPYVRDPDFGRINPPSGHNGHHPWKPDPEPWNPSPVPLPVAVVLLASSLVALRLLKRKRDA